MLFKTHIAFGFLIALLALKFLNPQNQLLFAFILLLGAAFPDIDHPKSRLGQMAYPFSLFFEHRGFFHSFFGIALFTFISYIISGSMIYSIAFLLGYASHILVDSFTKEGIMPIHPLSHFKFRGAFRTGAFYEYALLFVLMAFDIFVMMFIL